MQTAYDLIWMAAARTPDHLALVDDRSDRRLTYRQLLAEMDVIAAGLAARGVRAGSRVATVLPNLWEHCLVLLALQRLAAVPALLNFRLKPQDVGELIVQGELGGAVVLSDAELVSHLEECLPPGAPLLCVGEAVGRAEPFAACRGEVESLSSPPEPGPEELSFLFYTSGTTGLPKGVMLPHRTDEPRVVWLSTMLGLRGGTHLRALGISPLSHAIGFYGIFLATLAYNGTYFVLSAFDPERALDLIESHRINYLFSLPTIYAAVVAAPSYQPARMGSLQWTYWGGAGIEPELLDRLASEWPGEIGHIYGTTETMCSLVNPAPIGQHDVLFPAYSSRVRVTSGEDPARDARPEEQGELLVDATTDAIFSGYLGRPEETAAKVVDGWYHTGDAAVVSEDGSIRLCGRADDMIRSGGEYIQPEEVERVMGGHDEVAQCAVVGVTDSHWGQIAVACVVARGDVKAADLDRICRASRLANYKRPRGYLFLDALPMSAGNKLQRKVLRELATRARAGEGDLPLHEPDDGG